EVDIGSVYKLPPGTFVYNGSGIAGASRIMVPTPDNGQPNTFSVELITPDVMLFFESPPVSCDSRGFTFTDQGFPLDATTTGLFYDAPDVHIAADTAATDALGIHTLAQYNVYQCEPLRPGLFFRVGGGTPEVNEYFEGQNVTIEFHSQPDANGFYAL